MAERNRILAMVANSGKEMFFGDWNEDDEDDERYVQFPKSSYYAEQIVPLMKDTQFKTHFRLDPTTFEVLYRNLERIENRIIRRGKPEILLDKQLMITIWVLANRESFRSVADRFGIARSAAWRTVYRMCKKLLLLNQEAGIIKWPTVDQARITMQVVKRRTNFPGAVGFIDGSHIPINAPKDSPASYINRKSIHSLLLQGVCDHRMYYIDCYAGEVGSIHDQCLFRRSPLYEDIENNVCEFVDDGHLVGDGAYTLNVKLMKAFTNNGFLTDIQKNYNLTLSSARATIERSYAFLKGRFRRLKHLENSRVDLAVLLIMAACILHNICILQNDVPDIDVEQEICEEHSQNDSAEPIASDGVRQLAVEKRNNIANSIHMRLRR